MIPLLLALPLACSTPEAPKAQSEASVAAAPPAATPTPPLELAQPAIAGGYNTAEITDDIKAIATYAVSQLGLTGATLASVDKAEQQVVAGMNFRLDLTLSDGSRWHVVVFRSLDQQLSLTSKEALPGK
jgi:hypothetical protein